MGRLLVTVLALALLGYLGYQALYRSPPLNTLKPAEVELPPERLKAAREAARRIEALQQQQADKAEAAGER